MLQNILVFRGVPFRSSHDHGFFPPSNFWSLAVCKKWRGKPCSILSHDWCFIYLGLRGEGSPIETTHFSHAFFILNPEQYVFCFTNSWNSSDQGRNYKYYTDVFTMEWLEIDPMAFIPIGGISLSTFLLKLPSRSTEKWINWLFESVVLNTIIGLVRKSWCTILPIDDWQTPGQKKLKECWS